jgi:vacuolar-type H+-ATPase subunit I/STV1
VETFTIAEAAKLLEGQISREALKKRVQRPDAPGGVRSVKSGDGKRRIPRSELERVGLRIKPVEDSAASVVRELAEKIAAQERELTRLRALPERVAEADTARQEAERHAAELEAWREELLNASFWQRRRLLRSAA